ncbi:hypothetical protein C900_02286 [Fulvivirga imtechensis AK7]|uniref:Uncharacterized protein n=1 Tax=Fulvivirga imtechensis AK7 TaxID=1237149 RepID=L8JRW5_9BACT|nr:hypothetical protein C900_02286 [Fulvivirga imtechensis AK7]
MSRRVEWNPDHKNADDQQNAFIDKYLSWPPTKKWAYLMELSKQGLKQINAKGPRRIEWK